MATTPRGGPTPSPFYSPVGELPRDHDAFIAWFDAHARDNSPKDASPTENLAPAASPVATTAVPAGAGATSPVAAATADATALVGLAYDLDVFAALELPRFESSADATPTSTRPSKRPGYLAGYELDKLLNPFTDDVGAGASDRTLAKRAGVRPGQVRRWRRRHNLVGVPGARKSTVTMGFQSSLPRASLQARLAMHTTITGGRFKEPTYVLREPLRYERFARIVAVLTEAGLPTQFIASGIGVTTRDVEQARELAQRYGL